MHRQDPPPPSSTSPSRARFDLDQRPSALQTGRTDIGAITIAESTLPASRLALLVLVALELIKIDVSLPVERIYPDGVTVPVIP
jgi:hypothetical protein